MGKILLSVHLTSMLPCGQPDPPEITSTILNDDGAASRETTSGTGLAREAAAKASVAKVYFMMGKCGSVGFNEGIEDARELQDRQIL
jgi:hypothetical protein